MALFVAAGLVGGAVNSLAGGAKLFVFPLLLATGLPPIMANATGTVALWPAQLPAIWMHRRGLAGRLRAVLWRMAPAVVGTLCGAGLLIISSEAVFLAVIPFVLVGAVTTIALGNRTAIVMARLIPPRRRGAATGALMFGAGVYGGFFGAGMGFLLIAVITLAGVSSIREANAEKNITATAINTTAVVPFLASGLVHLPAAAGVLVGGLAGGYIGGHLARLLPDAPMRLVVAGLGLVLTIAFLFGR
ncbi:sulfite exporter TauE/SafE family protein [Rhodobacteraceae bacterium WD3A24]|nr:sulfite exporter TauE/SafE family protein [Rhodobacteraceae bacterium WD3A24]